MKRRVPRRLDGAPIFLAGDGRNPHIPHPGSPRLADWGATSISHSNTPHNPISPHIDEDALEGVYFAF